MPILRLLVALTFMVMAPWAPAWAQGPVPPAPPTDIATPESIEPVAPEEVIVQAPAAIEVELKGGLLSVKVAERSLKEVLEEVAAKADFKLKVRIGVETEPITAQFAGVPLEDGVRKLMDMIGHKNFLISYNKEGGIAKLELMGPQKQNQKGGAAKPADKRPGRSTPPQATSPTTPTQPRVPTRVMGGQPSHRPQTNVPSANEGYFPPGSMQQPPQRATGTPAVPYIPPARPPVYIPPKR